VETPASIRWADEARKGRRRLYPVTVTYTVLATAAIVYALGSNPRAAAAYWLLGLAFWTWMEYMVHRFVLHGVFPDGPGVKRVLHRLFDHLHVEHHRRPWDGDHINGTMKDTAPFLALPAALGLVLPPHTLLAFLAGFVQAYVVEEWVHHSVHFYHFKNPYFRYIKRHHLYHHSKLGSEIAFGLTSGMWDVVHDTRIPADVRAALYEPILGRAAARRPAP
jgi:sterol desaturase/sphingolipid hydroxylase (fatty acid hydroxylase superfamily)